MQDKMERNMCIAVLHFLLGMKWARHTTYLTILALLLLCMNAQASVISYDQSFANFGVSTGTETTGSYNAAHNVGYSYMSFDRFDSGLGTLTGVDISVSSNWDHYTSARASDVIAVHEHEDVLVLYPPPPRIISENWYANDTSVSSRGELYLAAQLVDSAGIAAESTFWDIHLLSCSDNRKTDYPEGEQGRNCNRSVSGISTFDDSLEISHLGLDYFIGSPPISMQLQQFSLVNVTCDDNDDGDYCDAYSHSSWDGTVTVSYSYAESTVPEPSSIRLLCLGLAGLGFAMRRRVALS